MWHVIGQKSAISLLQRSLEKDTLAHAYLFVGSAHVGKMTLALNLAQALNCDATGRPCGECDSCQKIASGKHADIQIIGPNTGVLPSETKPRTEISIDQIRELQHASSLPPFEGRHKVFIIDGAERLSIEAANCLLKTLEEPAINVIFILLTTNEQLLPATVVSRCQKLELPPLAITQVETALNGNWNIDPQKARLLARLSHGRMGWAISSAQDEDLLLERARQLDRLLDISDSDYEEHCTYAAELAARFSQDRGHVLEVLDLWLDWWRDLLLIKTGCGDTVTNVDRMAMLTDTAGDYHLAQVRTFIYGIQLARNHLMQNANPQLVLEVLMLSIPERKRRLKSPVR